MTSSRIAFVFAIGLAVLALFMINGAEAATLNDGAMIPDEENRVDADTKMQFTIVFDDADETISNLEIVVWFEGTVDTTPLACVADCSGLDGTYAIPGTDEDLLEAGTLVETLGSETIKYGFIASYDEDENGVHWPGEGSTHDSNVRVNTLPVLTDDATVSGGGMPEDTYTLTITYTDVDGHAGTVTATVCDVSDTCETGLSLSKQSGDESSGAVYGTDFTTELGGTLTVTVSATDSVGDDAEDDQTTTFSVDTTTPWLKNPSVSPTSAGEDDDITFEVISCVFDASTTGTPSVTVDVNSDGGSAMSEGAGSSLCKNGVIYSLTSTVPWSGSSQAVTFSASNDVADAADLAGPSVSINDVPTLTAGTAERHFNGVDFVFNVTASDANLDNGDTIGVYATIQFDSSKVMTCDTGSCTLTVAEADIIDQMGGVRTVTFYVEDDYWGDSFSNTFAQTIDVTKTSNFVMVDPADGSFQPGSGDYDFTITNSGNYADTFTISATSDNGWVGSYDDTVTVNKDESKDFTITMDVPNAAAGTVDHWSMAITAGNDDSQTDSHSGTTTVLYDKSVSVSIGTDAGSAVPNGQVTYSFVITNTGNGDQAFPYETNSAGDWGLGGGSGTTATLAMGASETVVVTHTVHEDAGVGDSDTITFDADGGPLDGAGRTATTTANQIYGASISFGTSDQGSALNPGDSFTISYTITNGGNGNDAFSVFFDASWMSASSGTTLSLGAGASGTATATITVPTDAPSGSSSTIAAHVTGGGGSSDNAGAAYTMTVADNTRSASIIGESGYTINKGDTSSGTVTITNTGVAVGFAVISAGESLSFDSSVISLGAGQSGTLSFTIHAAATGDVSFTVSDAVDGIAVSHTFAITAREFNSALLTTDTGDCGNTGITCVTDAAGGFDNGEYTNAGTFFTTMSATDANGMTGTHTFSTTIANAAPSVTAPMAPTDTIAQDEQSFSFTVPTDRDGTITQLVIDWGDGSKFTFDSSALAGKSAVATTHEYAEPGEKTITVTAYDNSGDSTIQTTTIEVGDRTKTLEGNSYLYNLVFLIGFFLLGAVLSGTSFKMLQGEIAGDEEMNDRDRQRLESVERRMESLSEREELLEVSAYDASRAATKLEEHLSAFNEILVKAQEIAAEEKLKELEAAEETKQKEEEQMQLDLEDPDIEMVAERFHDALGRLVNARGELSKIEEQLAHILKMERDEQLEKLTEMTESYETTKRKIDALQTSAEARDAAAVENNIMNLLSAAASGGSVGGADFGDFGDLGGDDEYEVEIYEDEDGSFYYIDPDTGEEVPCDEDGNAL